MEKKTSVLVILVFLVFCLNKQDTPEEKLVPETQAKLMEIVDTIQELQINSDNKIIEYGEYESNSNEIPPNGKYRFDIAFAEWQGKSMGEKVTVIVKGDSIKIVYEGDGSLTLTEKGEIIDQGQIMKHKSGDWIIGITPADKELDEVGGCTGGPAIIDFKNKKYWIC